MEIELVTRTWFEWKRRFLSDYFVKINKLCVAYCLYCNVDIVYGSSGKRNLLKYAQRNEKHAERRKIRVTSMTQEKTC